MPIRRESLFSAHAFCVLVPHQTLEMIILKPKVFLEILRFISQKNMPRQYELWWMHERTTYIDKNYRNPKNDIMWYGAFQVQSKMSGTFAVCAAKTPPISFVQFLSQRKIGIVFRNVIRCASYLTGIFSKTSKGSLMNTAEYCWNAYCCGSRKTRKPQGRKIYLRTRLNYLRTLKSKCRSISLSVSNEGADCF